jgi:hypothetical protein
MRTDWTELRRIDMGVEASVCIRCSARYSTDWATKLLSESTRSHVPEHGLGVGDVDVKQFTSYVNVERPT